MPEGTTAEKEQNPTWADHDIVAVYHNSIHGDKPNCLTELFEREVALLKDYPASSHSALIDVGCGPGALLAALLPYWNKIYGVDFNVQFLEFARSFYKDLKSPKCKMVHGDAQQLEKLLAAEQLVDPTVVCLKNSIGIFPAPIRGPIIEQMWRVAGAKGRVVFGVFNRAHLQRGFDEFYSQHPEVCGEVSVAGLDLAAGYLRGPDGYESHWWTKEEIIDLVKSAAPWPVVIETTEDSIGIFLHGRKAI